MINAIKNGLHIENKENQGGIKKLMDEVGCRAKFANGGVEVN